MAFEAGKQGRKKSKKQNKQPRAEPVVLRSPAKRGGHVRKAPPGPDTSVTLFW